MVIRDGIREAGIEHVTMRLLYVATRHLMHKGHPRVNSITSLLRHLSARIEVHLVYVSNVDADDQMRGVVPRLSSLKRLPMSSRTLLPALLAALARGRPLQTALYADARMRRPFEEAVEALRPDVLVYDTFRALPFRRWADSHSESAHVLDLDDLFSSRYSQASRSVTQGRTLGHAEAPAVLAALANLARRPLLAYESATVKRLERELPGAFDAVVLVSRTEAETLRERSDRSNVFAIPQLIPGLSFHEVHAAFRASRDAYFLGNFNYHPNVVTLNRLLDFHVPQIRRLEPEFTLRIYGPNLDARLQRKVEQVDGAVYCGFVDDVRDAVRDCPVLLAPIAYGSGVKTKVVEGMSWAKAVVTNSCGASGLDFGADVPLVVEDDETRQVERVIRFLHDGEEAQAMGAAAARFASEVFSPERLVGSWLDVLELATRR